MDREAFGKVLIAILPMLHCIAFSQLPQAADREDAVQETILGHVNQADTRDRFAAGDADGRGRCRHMGVVVAGRYHPDRTDTTCPEVWQQMVDAFEPVTVEGEIVSVTVHETLYDGFARYVVIDMQPVEEGISLVPNLMELDRIAGDAVDDFPDDVMLAEHIASLGYAVICRVDMSIGLKAMYFHPEMVLNED